MVKFNGKLHRTYDEIRNKKVWRIVKTNNLPFVRFSNFSDTDLTVTIVSGPTPDIETYNYRADCQNTV